MSSSSPTRNKRIKTLIKDTAATPTAQAAPASARTPLFPKTGRRGRPKARRFDRSNESPTEQMENVYVVGSNSGGELGLGPGTKSGTIYAPRINPHLSGPVGVVQIAAGPMHGLALTHDNKILTWGVNDLGALGRDTTWDGGLVDEGDSGSDDGAELNPRETTPTEVDLTDVPPGTVFTQVAAAASASFALTDDGHVYGWGTFRANDGKESFSPTIKRQLRPSLIPSLKGVTKLACGSDHVVALLASGAVQTWGVGTEGQLGRRFSPRVVDWAKEGLRPRPVAHLRRIVDVAAGQNHSFALDAAGALFSWGVNNTGQTGVHDPRVGDDGNAVMVPARVVGLGGRHDDDRDDDIVQISAGSFHTLARTRGNRCLAWGRLYSYATGLDLAALPAPGEGADGAVLYDSRGKPSMLTRPRPIEGHEFSFVAASSEHSLAITTDHKLLVWGLNISGQLGRPEREEELKVPTFINRQVLNGQDIVWVGSGSQYSILGARPSAAAKE